MFVALALDGGKITASLRKALWPLQTIRQDPMHVTYSLLILLVISTIGQCMALGAPVSSLRTVALTGMPVTASSQAETYSRFGGVNINQDGQVLFYAKVAGTA